MGLSDDEKKLLDELQRKAAEPDAEDFEVEIYDTNAGKGARVPISKAASWLHSTFGIGDPPAAQASSGEEETGGGGQGAPPATPGYFGRNRGAGKQTG